MSVPVLTFCHRVPSNRHSPQPSVAANTSGAAVSDSLPTPTPVTLGVVRSQPVVVNPSDVHG